MPRDLDLPDVHSEAARAAIRNLSRLWDRECRSTRLAHSTLLEWSRYFLPKHFSLPASSMHDWLAEQLDQQSPVQGQKINLVGPRGSAKSTVATLAFVLREAVTGRQPYIWIVSDTRHQAAAHLENIKAELVDNPRLAAAYPRSCGQGPVWRAGAIVLRNRAMIEAFGTGQRIRGRRRRHHRPTLIVCDDLQNDSHIQSSLARERSRAWFHGMLMKAGTPRTTVVSLGTALHRECLVMELRRTPGWTSRAFQSIERWPQQMQLWHQWEQIYADPERPDAREAALEFYLARRNEMSAEARVLWPQQEDLYTLMCMRVESGHTAFDREKQSVPVNPDLCEWPEGYFGDAIWFHEWPADLRVRTIALDPSKGADARRGDYSAFAILGVGNDGLLYVEADLARRPTPQIVSEGVELCRRFRPQALGVESNQFQVLLGADFAAQLTAQGLISVAPCMIENRLAKLVRIRRLGSLLAARRLRFKSNSPGTRLLVEQLREFPLAQHDDGPDALEMALRLAESLLRPPPTDGLGDRLI